MKRSIFSVIGLLAMAAGVAVLHSLGAYAQVPSIPAPYNVSLGSVLVNTLQTAGTRQSVQQNNVAYGGVMCTFNQTAKSGTPSTTFSIEGYDAASNTYKALVTSGAITDNDTPTVIVAYPGSVATSVPSGMVIAGLHVPRFWRVAQTIGGTGGPAITGTIGCDLLK